MYTRFQETAHRLLSRYGQPRTLILSQLLPGKGKFWETSLIFETDVFDEGLFDTEARRDLVHLAGVVLPVNARSLEFLDDRSVEGTLVEYNVRMVVIAAKDVNKASVPPIRPGDRFLFDAEAWSVLGVTEVSPGGIPIVYRVAVRR